MNGRRNVLVIICALVMAVFLVTAIVDVASAVSAPPERSKTGMVVSAQKLADEVGMKVLNNGGNAVDAAVAVGYALSVLHPAGAGLIGGGGFAVIYIADKKEIVTLDFREMVSENATPGKYLDNNGKVTEDKTLGYKAAATPGAVAGFDAMLKRYGTKKLSDLIKPAVSYAENGFIIGHAYEVLFEDAASRLRKFQSSRKYFLKPDGSIYKEGDRFVRKDLARTLRILGEKGPDAFYKGEIADLIVKDIVANGGFITKNDLANYKPEWREPVHGTYRGYDIYSMPPTSSGGIAIVQMLNIMEPFDIKGMGSNSSATINVLAEAMRYAFADRSAYLGDPAFVKVPLKGLTSKKYADELRGKIHQGKATPSIDVRPGDPQRYEGNHTTDYTIVDKWGNAIVVNFTIRDWFGSAAAVNGAGFLLNNTTDDLSAKSGVPNEFGLVYGDANLIAPRKRPLSSITPTIVIKDGKVFMALGSVGGPRIITTVLQVISNVVDHDMNVREAVEAPRVHMQWIPDQLLYEPGIPLDVLNNLKAMGYTLKMRGPIPPEFFGETQTILIDQKTGLIMGAQDPRGDYTK